MGIQRAPNLLRWTVLGGCLPYPGDPKSAIDCFFLFGISLHPGVTGSAPHWKFRGCRVHSFPNPQELLRPASWLALLSRTFTFELARRGRPQSASNMTTWINSQFPRQGHRIKIGELGRMANPAFGENLSFCGTSSHLFTMFAVALVITNKYNLHVQ